ncbi:MAG: hypothetical protein U0271_01405 [Polyangiaceae bacterium]
MANNDVFPVQTSGSIDDGGVQVVAQLDLTELDDKLAPILTDPSAKFAVKDATRPDVAKPTKGPHRYTIYVPHDDAARVNIGAPNPLKGETGIALETKTHIHAHAFDHSHETYLGLGAPSINTGFDTNRSTAGYSLHTWGSSNHFAKMQVAISSTTDSIVLGAAKDIRVDAQTGTLTLSGKVAVNGSSDGNITLTAGTDKKINTDFWTVVQAIGLTGAMAADFAAPGVGYFSPSAGSATAGAAGAANFIGGFATADAKALHDFIIVKSSGVIDKVLKHVAACAGLVLSFKKAKKEAQEGKTGWKQTKAYGAWAISVAKELYAIYSDFQAAKTSPAGEVKITAKNNASIAADGSVSIGGVKGVAISGFKSASMNSLACSIKGHKEATLWGGLGASVKSLAGDVALASDLKGASVTAKKDVKVASETGKATFTGDQEVQLNSVSNKAYVHGKEGSYIGAGTGQGFGVSCKPKGLSMGTTANADNFASAASDRSFTVLTFTDKIVTLQSGSDSKFMLRTSLFDLGTGEIKLAAKKGNVTVTGSKILLG